MDALTSFAINLKLPLLAEVSKLLSNPLIFTVVVLAVIFLAERRSDKQKKIVVALALAAVAGLALKSIYAVPRICAGELNCPTDYAFPSGHSVVAFTLMIAFLDKKEYPIFLVFGLFVAFTRLHLGVHSFEDVAAALPVALLAYHIVDSKWRTR